MPMHSLKLKSWVKKFIRYIGHVVLRKNKPLIESRRCTLCDIPYTRRIVLKGKAYIQRSWGFFFNSLSSQILRWAQITFESIGSFRLWYLCWVVKLLTTGSQLHIFWCVYKRHRKASRQVGPPVLVFILILHFLVSLPKFPFFFLPCLVPSYHAKITKPKGN